MLCGTRDAKTVHFWSIPAPGSGAGVVLFRWKEFAHLKKKFILCGDRAGSISGAAFKFWLRLNSLRGGSCSSTLCVTKLVLALVRWFAEDGRFSVPSDHLFGCSRCEREAGVQAGDLHHHPAGCLHLALREVQQGRQTAQLPHEGGPRSVCMYTVPVYL